MTPNESDARKLSASRRRSPARKAVSRLALYIALFIAFLYTFYPIFATAADAVNANIAALFVGNNIVLVAGAPFSQGIIAPSMAFISGALSVGAFPTRILNTLAIGGISVAVALLTGVPVSYMLARVEIRGRGAISFVLLALRTVSPFAVVIPLYIIFTRIGLWNTYQGVALAELVLILTVVVWMVKGFFQDIPKHIYDAAALFGASEGQIFLRVALPIVFTGIVITALFGFIMIWNEYLFQVILTGPSTSTVSVGVFNGFGSFQKTPDYVELEAAAVLAFIPAAVVLLAIRKYLAKGFSLATAR